MGYGMKKLQFIVNKYIGNTYSYTLIIIKTRYLVISFFFRTFALLN